MRLQCLVCKSQFNPYERFVRLTGQLQGKNGTGDGVSLAICTKHLNKEITDALLLDRTFFIDHTHQVYAEHEVFGD